MTDATQQGGWFVLTRPARLTFPKGLMEARQFEGKGDFKYQSRIFLDADHPDLPGVKETIKRVANEARPGIDINAFNKPLKNGDKEADKVKAKKGAKYKNEGEYQRGKVVIGSRSKFEPNLSVLLPNKQIVKLTTAELKSQYRDKFYFGANVIVEFNFVWYKEIKEGDKPGVTAYIQKVMAVEGGERIGGGRSEEDAFSGYLGHVSSASPLGETSDDDIPF